MSRLSANDERVPLIQGKQGRYYVVDGVKYEEHFPQEWALNHLPYPKEVLIDDSEIIMTGPKECLNCSVYGSINDVFVFYCANCYKSVYNGERGGFIWCSSEVTEKELWEKLPYMNGILFDEIGDTDNPTKWSEYDDCDITEYDTDKLFKRMQKRENKKQKDQMRLINEHKQSDIDEEDRDEEDAQESDIDEEDAQKEQVEMPHDQDIPSDKVDYEYLLVIASLLTVLYYMLIWFIR